MNNDLLAEQYASYIVDLLDYDCLIERATEAIYRDTLKGLKDGSIEASDLFEEMKE